jgi:hypothetical protein
MQTLVETVREKMIAKYGGESWFCVAFGKDAARSIIRNETGSYL